MSEKDSAAAKKPVEFDLDDEATWPTDVNELAEVAGNVDPGAGHLVEGRDAEAETEAANEAEAGKKPDTAAAPASDGDISADGVLAKDGKHVLPISVLQNEREKSKDLERQLEEERAASKARLEELEAKASNATANKDLENADDDTNDSNNAGLSDTEAEIKRLNDLAEEVLEEYDDDKLAESYRAQARLLKRHAALEQRINDQDASRVKEKQDTETNAVQDALDNSPTLTEWANSEDTTNHDRATKLNKFLIETDKEYAAMTWQERFSVLPNRVKAVYPDVGEVKGTTNKGKPLVDVEQAKADASKSATPTSISDITGGDAPAGTEAEALETMSSSSVTRKMEDLADKGPEALEAYLRDIS